MSRTQREPNALSGARTRRKLTPATLLVALGVVALIVYMARREPPPAPPISAAPAAGAATNGAAVAGEAELESLKGRWHRPDGGYILEVKYIDASGAVTAQYLNPRPIHVARAQAQRSDGASKLFLELRDEGYPGCTYALTYHPGRDELEGVYFQAAMGEHYDVVFERLK